MNTTTQSEPKDMKPTIMDDEDAIRAERQLTCPRCQRAAAELIRGVCPSCKRLLHSTHKQVLEHGFKETPVSICRTIPEQAFFDEVGQKVSTTAGDSGEAMIQQFCIATGLNYAVGIMVLSEADKLLSTYRSVSADEKTRNTLGLVERGFLKVQEYVKAGGNRDMAERCMWLLLGFPAVAGAGEQAALVKLLGIHKATVCKCIEHFQKQLPELPLLPEQRDEAARENMTKARLGQLPETPIT